MIEKLKSLGSAVWAIITFPLAVAVFILFKMLVRQEQKAAEAEAKANLASALTKQEVAKNAADAKVGDFESLSAKYESEHGGKG